MHYQLVIMYGAYEVTIKSMFTSLASGMSDTIILQANSHDYITLTSIFDNTFLVVYTARAAIIVATCYSEFTIPVWKGDHGLIQAVKDDKNFYRNMADSAFTSHILKRAAKIGMNTN
jgi:hypothetical protein